MPMYVMHAQTDCCVSATQEVRDFLAHFDDARLCFLLHKAAHLSETNDSPSTFTFRHRTTTIALFQYLAHGPENGERREVYLLSVIEVALPRDTSPNAITTAKQGGIESMLRWLSTIYYGDGVGQLVAKALHWITENLRG
ncbi:MAG: hypothetical protein ACYC9Z_13860 [Casimicrobiaceae bacterium]